MTHSKPKITNYAGILQDNMRNLLKAGASHKFAIISLVAGISLVICSMHILTSDVIVGLYLLAATSLSALLFWLFPRYIVQKDCVKTWPLVVFSVLYAFSLVAGSYLWDDSLSPISLSLSILLRGGLTWILITLGLCGVVFSLAYFTTLLNKKRVFFATRPTRIKPLLVFAIIWFLIIAAWVICWLALWPGSFAYDINTQNAQIITRTLSNNHPLWHTFFWGFCVQLSSILQCQAIELYTLMQILFLAGAIAFCFTQLYKNNIANWFLIILLVGFVLLNPIAALIAISPAPDTLFAGVFLLLLYALYKLMHSKNQPHILLTIALCAFLTLGLRHNFFIVWLLFATILIIVLLYHKQLTLSICGALVVPLLSISMFYGFVFPALGVVNAPENQGNLLTVPRQQIARAALIHERELTSSDITKLSSLFPGYPQSLHAHYDSEYNVCLGYNARFGDTLRDLMDTSEDDYLLIFVTEWIALGMRYPADYFIAFAQLTLPYWYPLSTGVDPIAQRGYIEIGIYANENVAPFKRHSQLPMLEKYYSAIADYSAVAKLPFVLRWPFALSTPFWLLLYSLAIKIHQNDRKNIVLLLLPLLFLLSYFFGPIMNTRYIFPLIIIYPFLIANICIQYFQTGDKGPFENATCFNQDHATNV